MDRYHVGLADGPTEVHKITLARRPLSNAESAPGRWRSGVLPLTGATSRW